VGTPTLCHNPARQYHTYNYSGTPIAAFHKVVGGSLNKLPPPTTSAAYLPYLTPLSITHNPPQRNTPQSLTLKSYPRGTGFLTKKSYRKSQIIDEVVSVLGYHRKYAIQGKRSTSHMGNDSSQCCSPPAELLATHKEVTLTPEIRQSLAKISRTMLSRRLTTIALSPRGKYPRNLQKWL